MASQKRRGGMSAGQMHRLSLTALLAWVALGSDGLSSVIYGPEEAFLALHDNPALGVLVALAAAATIWIIAASYSQVIALFPSGAGGYAVASKLLSPAVGMVSGCALLIDYVLTITISIASGMDAVFSFIGPEWQPHKLAFAVAAVLALMAVNLRGVREAVVPLVPIFLAFLITHIVGIGTVLWHNADAVSALPAEVQASWGDVALQSGSVGAFFIVAHAFATGAGTFTGIEAVSNGVSVLREPRIATARKTLRLVALSLSVLSVGLMVAYLVAGVQHEDGKTLNAVLWQSAASGWGVWGIRLVQFTLLTEALLLLVAAQTGFVDGPRVLASMAADRYWPAKFSVLTDKLVATRGVMLMGLAAAAAMILTDASVKSLVVLYSLSVFVTFTLTHLGVVRHCLHPVKGVPPAGSPRRTLAFAIPGLIVCSGILVLVLATKGREGGWRVLLVLSLLCAASLWIRSRYRHQERRLSRVKLEELESTIPPRGAETAVYQRARGRSAAILVHRYDAQGLALLDHVAREYANDVEEFVFLGVGLLDAGAFKGADSAAHLEAETQEHLDRYVELSQNLGYPARSAKTVALDLGDGVEELVEGLRKERSWTLCFVAETDNTGANRFDRWLDTNLSRVLRRRLQAMGQPFRIVSVRPQVGRQAP